MKKIKQKILRNFGKDVKGKNMAAVEKILVSGADPNPLERSDKSSSPLHIAVNFGADVEIFKALLSSGANIEAKNEAHETVLYSAVKSGLDLKVIITLLEAGADIHCTVDQNTLLHVVRIPDVAKELLSRDLSVKATNSLKQTPVHCALNRAPRAYTLEIIRLLLNHGALINARDCCGATPLHVTTLLPQAANNIVLVQELLRRGSDVNARDLSGRTPLYYLMEYSSEMEEEYCNMELVRLLIFYGSDINLRCGYRSPLSEAYLKNIYWAKFLIKTSMLKDSKETINAFSYKRSSECKSLMCFVDECKTEILQLSKDMIYNRFSMLDLIVQVDETVPPMYLRKNEDILQLYPLYGDIVLPKVKLCLEKAELLDKLSKMHITIIHEEKEVILNCHCLQKVAEFLPNLDICNLISAVED